MRPCDKKPAPTFQSTHCTAPLGLAISRLEAVQTSVSPLDTMDDFPVTPPTQHSHFSSNSNSSALSSSLRRERGAIAAQACDTCRSRKQRCDEQRPRCGTCQKFRLECNYREPQPTKKDKTLVEILDRIKTLESKIDHLSHRSAIPPSTPAYTLHQANHLPSPLSAVLGSNSPFHFPEGSNGMSGPDHHYQYVSCVHEMLKWPAMQQLFATVQPKIPNINLTALGRDGPARMLAVRRETSQHLPTDTPTPVGRGSGMDIHNPVTGQVPITTLGLTWDTMQSLSKAYFDTINLSYPLLNRQSFMSETLHLLFNNGFDQSMASTVAFLVFALGEVALAASDGLPVHVYSGRASGVKGGSKERPPGLELFNEARRRMGFNLTECSLENVQIFALASIYYGTCYYHLDFWRMTTSASLACQALITSNPNALSSAQADLIRRAFWHCSIMETGLNMELGFPLTGLERMEPVVGLPDFSGPYSEDDYLSNQESHFQEHFASQIVLRRLVVDFHGVLTHDMTRPSSLGLVPTPFSSTVVNSGVSLITLRQLALQLEQWRGMLPAHLRWQEDNPGAFPCPNGGMYNASLFTPASTPISPVMPTPQPTTSAATVAAMFTTDLDAVPSRYSYVLDIQVALLRSRYYWTKYLIHRPFIYKALHHPDAMVHDDAVGVADCLRASLKWPVAMSPTCKHKRLVPCSFFFTQNFFGILVLLHLTTTVPILRQIRSTLCGERFELDVAETVGLYLDWLRDLNAIDTADNWHWEVVKVIYGLEE